MTVAITRAALAVLVLVSVQAIAEPVNRCDDPYWKDTLRCVLFPNEPPQPNRDEVPRGQQPLAYSRVFLADNPDVRCTDGTSRFSTSTRRSAPSRRVAAAESGAATRSSRTAGSSP